jgi:hypothetical protein
MASDRVREYTKKEAREAAAKGARGGTKAYRKRVRDAGIGTDKHAKRRRGDS